MHQSASISQRYVGMKTMVFVTFRWGNAAKRLGSDAPLMHFSPQRDVVMHSWPQRDVTKQRHIWRSKIATRYRIIWEMRYFVRLSRLQYNFNLFFEV